VDSLTLRELDEPVLNNHRAGSIGKQLNQSIKRSRHS
jgi:hypothetical protein